MAVASSQVPGARRANVTQASPLTVTLWGDTVAVPAVALTAYTPTVGDVVAVLRFDTSLVLVLGKFA